MVSGRFKRLSVALALYAQLHGIIESQSHLPHVKCMPSERHFKCKTEIALLENGPAGATHVEKFLHSQSLSTAAPRNAEARSAEEEKKGDIPCPSPQTVVGTGRTPLPFHGSWGTPCSIAVARCLRKQCQPRGSRSLALWVCGM